MMADEPAAGAAPATPGLVGAAAWLGGLQALAQGVALLSSIVVARVLGPSPYGIYALVVWVLGVASLFREPGIAPAIATGRLRAQEGLAAAQGLVVAASCVWTAALLVLADYAADFFSTPPLARPLRVAAASLVLWGLSVVPQARLQRAARFRALAWVGLVQQLVASLLTVVLALSGFGIWALVLPLLAAPAFALSCYWWLNGGCQRISFRFAALKGHRREAADIFGFRFLGHITRNADDLIVARVCGQLALGQYSFAYAFVRRPVALVSQALAPPILSMMSRKTLSDAERDSHFVDILVALSRYLSPVLVLLACLAQAWVPWVFGERWEPAVGLFRVFLLLGSVQLLGTTLGAPWLALGHTRALLRLTLVSGLASVLAFLVGARWGGPHGVALAYSAVSAGLLIPHIWLTARVCQMRITGLGRRLTWAVLDQLLAGAVAYWVETELRGVLPVEVRGALGLAAGGLVYCGLVLTLRREELRKVRVLVPLRFQKHLHFL